MIIIDKGANDKLVQAIKSLATLEGKHCIRIHPVGGHTEQARQHVIAHSQKHLPDANIYFCEDGETFLLAPASSAKECKKTMLAIAAALKIQPVERIGERYDLALQSDRLLVELERKIENRRKAEKAFQKRQAQEQAAMQIARKRHAILEKSVPRSAEKIAAQRGLRSEPMLMIIEDDPFSRRLVENVLQKQYRLTGLDSAEDALATYADLSPDLLFLDINLPDVTGHELLEKIIALDPKAYVVMLSGNADKNNVMQAMERGAKGFVAKPFSRDKLFQYIERCPTISREKVQ